uniref:Uncharacterized protein n=1 Tax=Cannabis sativa TaxID=3483 RepID=A0A803P111_CANSA
MILEGKGTNLAGRVSMKVSSSTAGHAKGIREPKSHSIPGAEAIYSYKEHGLSKRNEGIQRHDKSGYAFSPMKPHLYVSDYGLKDQALLEYDVRGYLPRHTIVHNMHVLVYLTK